MTRPALNPSHLLNHLEAILDSDPHMRWVIKMMAGNFSNLQEIVERESELVKTLAESSKMNYRAWNHRCWLVSYMSDSQVLLELQCSRDWAAVHVADNSCFHYRARLLLQMIENLRHNNEPGGLSGAEFHQVWKEELDWVGMLIRRYVGREALWLHRRFLSLVWLKHLASDDQSISCHYCCRSSEICDISTFVKVELMLFSSCITIPDNEFGDYQAQATYSAAYIMWLAKVLLEEVKKVKDKNIRCLPSVRLNSDYGFYFLFVDRAKWKWLSQHVKNKWSDAIGRLNGDVEEMGSDPQSVLSLNPNYQDSQ
ncbi:UNVERIFIED_CONTAM: hypothetical protein Sradi_1917500 [Sesamum radiatum]|uniref:Uncharacterized protein n=1 Tax=Sesamum radiatum TaxID=300843 RepID=A0AAW2TDP9_SESRA